MEEWVYEKIKNYTISSNDVYMTIVGATIGKCGLVPKKFDNMNLTENAAKITPIFYPKEFLKLFLESSFLQKQFIEKTKKVGVEKMALIRFKASIFPLPSVDEQKAIVSKVNQLMAWCDELEKKIKKRDAYQEKMMQAVVNQAFKTEKEPIN
ncbi:hypothetical protein GF376_03805 [Candidatus Peregrinibacteria bacterium]|nr:hypothetical protein [Candidatus Peregrinibacteria bacterium]